MSSFKIVCVTNHFLIDSHITHAFHQHTKLIILLWGVFLLFCSSLGVLFFCLFFWVNNTLQTLMKTPSQLYLCVMYLQSYDTLRPQNHKIHEILNQWWFVVMVEIMSEAAHLIFSLSPSYARMYIYWQNCTAMLLAQEFCRESNSSNPILVSNNESKMQNNLNYSIFSGSSSKLFVLCVQRTKKGRKVSQPFAVVY